MRERRLGINIRVTEAEKERIMNNAEKCGLTTSEYLRQIAMKQDPKELPRRQIYDEMVELDRHLSALPNLIGKTTDPQWRGEYDEYLRKERLHLTNTWKLLLSNFEKRK